MKQFDYVGIAFSIIILIVAIDLLVSPLMLLYTLEHYGLIITEWMVFCGALLTLIIMLIEIFIFLLFMECSSTGCERK